MLNPLRSERGGVSLPRSTSSRRGGVVLVLVAARSSERCRGCHTWIGWPLDPGVLDRCSGAEWLYGRALLVLRGRGVRIPAWQQLLARGRWPAGGRPARAARRARRRPDERAHGPAPADRRRRGAADAGRPAHARCSQLLPAAAGARHRSPGRAGCGAFCASCAGRYVAIPLYVVCSTAGTSVAVRGGHAPSAVHALQHLCFVARRDARVVAGARARARAGCAGELWKIGHILAARFMGMFLGMASSSPARRSTPAIYGSGRARAASRRWPTSRSRAALMIVLDIFVILFALALLLLEGRGGGRPRSARRPSRPQRRLG